MSTRGVTIRSSRLVALRTVCHASWRYERFVTQRLSHGVTFGSPRLPRVRYVPRMATILSSTCETCGVTFLQPDDPGRRREYCSNACRQRAYRARGGRASGTRRESARARARREEQEAWAREEARRERDRQRKARERGRDSAPGAVPDWCRPRSSDDARTAKRRATCRALLERAGHPGTNAHEASACRDKAEAMRARYGL